MKKLFSKMFCWLVGRHAVATHHCFDHLGEIVRPMVCLGCGKREWKDSDRVVVINQCNCYDERVTWELQFKRLNT